MPAFARLHGALALGAVIASSPLAAQQPVDTARLHPVVVTATRSPVDVTRVPASVTVLSGDALRAQGITQLADALRQVPGVSLLQAGSFGAQSSLFLRGGQNTYTKVLVDGVAVNDPGGAFDFSTLTLDDVERIEVVRGPASVLYGSDAVTGVIQVITRHGGANHRRVEARGGSFGSYDLSADLGGTASRATGTIGGATHASRGIYAFNSDYRNRVLTGAGSASAWRGATVRGSARFSDLKASYPTDFTGAVVDSNAFRTERRTVLGAELDQDLPRAASLQLLLSSSLTTASIDDPGNTPDASSSTYDTQVRRQGAEVRLLSPLTPAVNASAGVTAEWQGGLATGVTTGQWGSTDETRSSRNNRGAYAQLQGTWPRTSAVLGARYDHSQTFGDFGTWRAALSQQLFAGTRLRASIGTAFREPSFMENFAGAYNIANPNLEPERTRSWELGVDQSFLADRVRVGATGYAQRFEDLIVYQFVGSDAQYQNVASARANGGELTLSVIPVAHWTVDGSASYVDTRVLSAGLTGAMAQGERLLRRPMHSYTAGLGYRAHGAAADLRANIVGRRNDVRFLYADPYSRAESLPSYVKLDLSGELPVATRAALTLRVENLGDVKYETIAGYGAPRRMVFGGVRATY